MPDNLPQQPDGTPNIVIYHTADGRNHIQVQVDAGSVWLAQQQLAVLFETSKQNVSLHLKNIFKEGELDEKRVVKEYLTTAADGKNYKTKFFNLDAILAVGYRVRSPRGVQFRQWATENLREFIIKGFVLDDERLKGRDYADPETGESLAIFDMVWPNGVQEELSQPVAILLDEPKSTWIQAQQAGYRQCFSTVEDFKNYVRHEILDND